MSEQTSQSAILSDDDQELKTFLDSIGAYIKAIWDQKWLVFLLAIVFAGLLIYRQYKQTPLYVANLTFIISEDEGDSAGGVGSLVGLLGGGRAEYNQARIVALAASELLTNQILEDTVKYQGTQITIKQLIEQVEGDRFNLKENDSQELRFAKLQNLLAGPENDKRLYNVYLNEDTGIFEIVSETQDPFLSRTLSSKLYEKLSLFYIEKKVKPNRENYNLLKFQSDSLKSALSYYERKLLNLRKNSLATLPGDINLEKNKLQRNITMTGVLLVENEKVLQSTKFIVDKVSTVFQLIDGADGIIKTKKKYYAKFSAIGVFLGAVLACIYIIGKEKYNQLYMKIEG